MPRVTIELTNRCNLRCQHCFAGRHGGNNDLPLPILYKVLDEARCNGFDEISFTGGEPTLYRHFTQALQMTYEAGYRFGFVSNGQNFPLIYPRLQPYQDRLVAITFSLDGADQETHDQLRGPGSFRKVMAAISICVVQKLPFTINMVVTSHNRHQLAEMVGLVARLGGHGLRFGHLMHSRLTTHQGFDLTPQERKAVEQEIRALNEQSPIPIAMAPGYYTTDLFPCAPLQGKEVNIDYQGNFTKCCHLSSHGEGVGQKDMMGNLSRISFGQAYQRLLCENQQFQKSKKHHFAGKTVQDEDFFPCWFCSLQYEKVGWLATTRTSPWSTQAANTQQSCTPIALYPP